MKQNLQVVACTACSSFCSCRCKWKTNSLSRYFNIFQHLQVSLQPHNLGILSPLLAIISSILVQRRNLKMCFNLRFTISKLTSKCLSHIFLLHSMQKEMASFASLVQTSHNWLTGISSSSSSLVSGSFSKCVIVGVTSLTILGRSYMFIWLWSSLAKQYMWELNYVLFKV